MRANRSLPGWRRVPEWDLLILPATSDAEQAAGTLDGADQDGIFVRVVKRAGSGDRARTAEAALTRCLDAHDAAESDYCVVRMPPWPRKPSFRAVAAVRSYSRAPA